MIQGDGDYLLEEFHEAGILLPEERALICMKEDVGRQCECDRCALDALEVRTLKRMAEHPFTAITSTTMMRSPVFHSNRAVRGVLTQSLMAQQSNVHSGLGALIGGGAGAAGGDALGMAGLRYLGMLP